MARGKETEHTRYFKKTIEAMGGYGYKIPDDITPGAFRLARPYDFFACVDGRAIAIEFKWSNKPASINQKTLSANQHDGLRKFSASGGLALVGLFFRAKRADTRLILWSYDDFQDRGRVTAREQLESPHIAFKAQLGQYDASQTKEALSNLFNLGVM